MTLGEAIEILEEVKELDDTLYAYSSAYMEALEVAISALKEVQQYREIGTVEECREAVEKQKGMQVNEIHVDEYFCPACGSENNCDYGKVHDKYCPICGHAIYQEESEEE